MAYSARGLLVATHAVDLDPCLLWTPGRVLLGESEAKPSRTRREHEPNGCSGLRYKTKRKSHLISIANCRRVSRKINRQRLRTMEELLEYVCRHLPA